MFAASSFLLFRFVFFLRALRTSERHSNLSRVFRFVCVFFPRHCNVKAHNVLPITTSLSIIFCSYIYTSYIYII